MLTQRAAQNTLEEQGLCNQIVCGKAQGSKVRMQQLVNQQLLCRIRSFKLLGKRGQDNSMVLKHLGAQANFINPDKHQELRKIDNQPN